MASTHAVDQGAAILFAGFDLPEGERASVEDWHTSEHLPERLALPGFLSGRRFTSIRGTPRYVILYELSNLEALQSAPYLERLNAPSPWTSRSVRLFENNFRIACPVLADHSRGLGTYLLSLAVPRPEVDAWRAALPDLADTPGLAALRLAAPDQAVSSIRTAESHASRNAVPLEAVFLAEADEQGPLENLSARIAALGLVPLEERLHELQAARWRTSGG